MQPEFVERLRPQSAHDLADVFHAGAGRFLEFLDRVMHRGWGGAFEPLELQHDAGEGLADLVVQLACEPHALVLLGGQRASTARASLVLKAIEHRVECVTEVGDLGIRPLELQPPAGRVRVDPPHHRRELLERAEDPPQQQQVDGDHEYDAAGQHDSFGDLEPWAHGGR